MIALIVLVLSSFTLGTALLRLLRINIGSPTEALFHTVCAGLGAWCGLLFVTGHLFLFQQWILVSLSIALALPAPVLIYLRFRGTLRRLHIVLPSDTRGFSKSGLNVLIRKYLNRFTITEIILLGSIGAVLVLTFVTSFAPVVGGIRNDEICTHLSMPKEWMRYGGLADIPYSISYQAGNAHLWFLLTSCFSSESGPHLVSWLSLVLCLIAVYHIARSFMSRKAAIIAITIAAVNPLVFRGANIAFVDLESTLFAIAPICLLFAYARQQRNTLLILCGFYMAIGVGIKPTNIVYAAAILVVTFVWWLINHQKFSQVFGRLMIVCVTALIVGAPWPVRNLLLTGSPTFPPPIKLYELGNIKPIIKKKASFTYQDIKSYYDYCLSRYGDYHRTIPNFLKLPWDVTMYPWRFQIGDSIGTVLLSFLPLVLLFWPLPGAVWVLTEFAGLSALLLYFGVLPESRYYIGVLMVLSPVIAFTTDRLSTRKFISKISTSVLFVNVIFSLAVAIRISVTPVKTIINRQFRNDYVQANRPFNEAFKYIADHNITEVRVCYPSQVFYYLSARYIVDPDATKLQPDPSHSTYVLDIDYSQTLGRDPNEQRGSYCYSAIPPYTQLIFDGPDARIYKLSTFSGVVQ